MRTWRAWSWLLAGACLGGFVIVFLMVLRDTGIVAVDHTVAAWVYLAHNRFQLFGLHFSNDLSPVVDAVILGAVGVAASLLRRSWAPVLAALVGIAVTSAVVLGFKYGVVRQPPQGHTVSRGAFPSGHTASALVMLSTAALIGWRGRARVVALAVAFGLGGLVGACMVYDRLHWLSDVVGAVLLAPVLLRLITATPAFQRADPARRRPQPQRRLEAQRPADDLLHDLGRPAVDRLDA